MSFIIFKEYMAGIILFQVKPFGDQTKGIFVEL